MNLENHLWLTKPAARKLRLYYLTPMRYAGHRLTLMKMLYTNGLNEQNYCSPPSVRNNRQLCLPHTLHFFTQTYVIRKFHLIQLEYRDMHSYPNDLAGALKKMEKIAM